MRPDVVFPVRRRNFLRAVLASVLVALVFAPTAAAQDEPVFSSREGLGYEVFEDGTIVIGGDVVGDCRSLLEDARASGTEGSKEIKRQVRVCTEAGFPPRGAPARYRRTFPLVRRRPATRRLRLDRAKGFEALKRFAKRSTIGEAGGQRFEVLPEGVLLEMVSRLPTPRTQKPAKAGDLEPRTFQRPVDPQIALRL